jgi:integrase
MRGHIRKRSRGSWSIVVDAGKDPETGNRRQHWHTIKGTKRDAQRALNEMLVAMEKGSYVKPNRLTVGDWLAQWVDSYVAMHTTLRTQESYRSIIRCHLMPSLGSIPLKQLQP